MGEQKERETLGSRLGFLLLSVLWQMANSWPKNRKNNGKKVVKGKENKTGLTLNIDISRQMVKQVLTFKLFSTPKPCAWGF